jgi:hypothetical protein
MVTTSGIRDLGVNGEDVARDLVQREHYGPHKSPFDFLQRVPTSREYPKAYETPALGVGERFKRMGLGAE